MVRAFYGRDTRVIQTVPSQTWLALEEDSISPAWCPRFFASIVVIGVNIKLVCGGESNRMLRIISEGYPFHHLLTAHYERDITQLYCVCMYIYMYIYIHIYILQYTYTHICADACTSKFNWTQKSPAEADPSPARTPYFCG